MLEKQEIMYHLCTILAIIVTKSDAVKIAFLTPLQCQVWTIKNLARFYVPFLYHSCHYRHKSRRCKNHIFDTITMPSMDHQNFGKILCTIYVPFLPKLYQKSYGVKNFRCMFTLRPLW